MRIVKKLQKATAAVAGAVVLLLSGVEGKGASWQDELQGCFDIVETFDELQDWTPGGQWYSGAGCPTCPSNFTLPMKKDGSRSIWQLWNNKGLSFQFTPGKGTFAIGDLITGATSGTSATVRRVWNLDGKWYIQLTNGNTVQGTSRFVAGERISSGSKTGSNLQWPLFIADHGEAYTWRGRGKSLVMDIGDNDNTKASDPTMAGLGAQRMATFFGDGVTGKSGYKKIHVFFMIKMSPTFFNRCLGPGTTCVAGGYDPLNVVKVFCLNSGFTGVSRWGTSTEAAQVGGNNRYRLPEYGLNFTLFQIAGGGLTYPRSIFFTENSNAASGASPDFTYSHIVSGRPVRNGSKLNLTPYISSGDWFGVEIGYDIGTVGKNDGSAEFWIYDKNGAEKGRYSVAGQKYLMHFDHFYNKLVLGGNRLSRSGATGSLDSRWWIDDVIIHGSRIGQSYFKRLAAREKGDMAAPVAASFAPAAKPPAATPLPSPGEPPVASQ